MLKSFAMVLNVYKSLPSAMSSSEAKFIPNSLLQNAIRLGKAVLFAYQSPPPEYFSLAIFNEACAKALPQSDTIISRVVSVFMLFEGCRGQVVSLL